MAAPSGEQIEIAFGEQRAVVTEVGGGLRTFTVEGREVLDGYQENEMCRGGRGQVLAPWPNRILDGSYEFNGRRHQLPLNEPDRHNAIHGLVRWAAWTITERVRERVQMEYILRPQPGYPFSLVLAMEYMLSSAGLRVRATATNAGSDRCPFGSGAHPYLSPGTDTVDCALLQIPASTVLQSDERGIPLKSHPVQGTEYDFRQPRAIGSTILDHAFTGFERDEQGIAKVRLNDPESGNGLELWFDQGYPYVMVFTGDPLPDIARCALAVEPMTCPPNAFRTGESIVILEPGQATTSEWGISHTTAEPRD